MTNPLPPALDCISLQLHAAVALIQFNRPKLGNALNQKTFQVCIILLLLLGPFSLALLILTGNNREKGDADSLSLG